MRQPESPAIERGFFVSASREVPTMSIHNAAAAALAWLRAIARRLRQQAAAA